MEVCVDSVISAINAESGGNDKHNDKLPDILFLKMIELNECSKTYTYDFRCHTRGALWQSVGRGDNSNNR